MICHCVLVGSHRSSILLIIIILTFKLFDLGHNWIKEIIAPESLICAFSVNCLSLSCFCTLGSLEVSSWKLILPQIRWIPLLLLSLQSRVHFRHQLNLLSQFFSKEQVFSVLTIFLLLYWSPFSLSTALFTFPFLSFGLFFFCFDLFRFLPRLLRIHHL